MRKKNTKVKINNSLSVKIICMIIIIFSVITVAIASIGAAKDYQCSQIVAGNNWLYNKDYKTLLNKTWGVSGGDFDSVSYQKYMFCVEHYNKNLSHNTNGEWLSRRIMDLNHFSKPYKIHTGVGYTTGTSSGLTKKATIYGMLAYYAYLQNTYGFDRYNSSWDTTLKYYIAELKKDSNDDILRGYDNSSAYHLEGDINYNKHTSLINAITKYHDFIVNYISIANNTKDSNVTRNGDNGVFYNSDDKKLFSIAKDTVKIDSSGKIGPLKLGLKEGAYSKISSVSTAGSSGSSTKLGAPVGVEVYRITIKTNSSQYNFEKGNNSNKCLRSDNSQIKFDNDCTWAANFYLKPSKVLKASDIKSITAYYRYTTYSARFIILSGNAKGSNYSTQGYMAFDGNQNRFAGTLSLPKPTAASGTLTITKTDAETKEKLAGAKFKLLQETGTNSFKTYKDSIVTDSNGQVKVTGIPLGYNYYLQELSSTVTNNYDIKSLNVSGSGGTPATINGTPSIKITKFKANSTSSVSQAVTLTNKSKTKQAKIKIRKVDSSSTSSGISGVVFDILQKNGSTVKSYKTVTTNSSGYTDEIGLPAGYIYYISEKTGNSSYYSDQLGVDNNGGNSKNKITTVNGSKALAIYNFENASSVNYSQVVQVVLTNPRRPSGGGGSTPPPSSESQSSTEEGYLDIKGRVFLDVPASKTSKPDGIYGGSDRPMSGIRVILYRGGSQYSSTYTDSSGNYSFTNLSKSGSYYLSYTYDGVTYSATYYGQSSSNGSFATETLSDRQSINNTYRTVSNSTSKSSIQINAYTGSGGRNSLGYITGYSTFAGRYYTTNRYRYETEYETRYDNKGKAYTVAIQKTITIVDGHVENINFGMIEREKPDVSLAKDVYSASVRIKDHEETFMYNSRRLDTSFDTWEISQRLSLSDYFAKTYDRTLFASDYEYRAELYKQNQYGSASININTDTELKVFVTYIIKVINNSPTLACEINDFVDYYDQNYTFDSSRSYAIINNSRKTIYTSSSPKAGYTQNFSGFRSMFVNVDSICSNAGVSSKLEPGGTLTFYLTYEVNKDGNRYVILDQDTTSLTLKSGKENIAEINTYSSYYGSSTPAPSYSGATYQPYGTFDQDSTPANLTDSNKRTYSSYEDDTDHAPNIRIQLDLDHDVRSIDGIVWEDYRTEYNSTYNTNIGNGQRDSNEPLLNGLKVQLVEVINGQEFIWKEFESGSKNDLSPIIGFKINGIERLNIESSKISKGKYAFKSYIPGYYFIRFIYGDSVKTALSTATTWCSGGQGLNSYSYNGLNYKSTIYRKGNTSLNSDAKDVWARRLEVQNNFAKMNNHLANVADIYKRDVEKDPTVNQLLADELINKANMNAITETYDLTITNGDLNNIDLGLQERAKPQLTINKTVTNIKVVLANGTILYDANDKMSHVIWNIQKTKHEYSQNKGILSTFTLRSKKGLAQLTVDEEYLTGATVYITYDITVENVGEADYSDENYYNTGNVTSSASLVKVSADRVFDYLDNNISFNENLNQGWKTVEDPSGGEKADYLVNNYVLSKDIKKDISTVNTIIETADFKKDLAPGEKISKQLVLTKTISGDEGETSYGNTIEIIEITNPTGVNQKSSVLGNQNPIKFIAEEIDSAVADTVTLLTPFGAAKIGRQKAIIALVSLTILAGGIIITIKLVRKKHSD